jgi:hypothetical protein
MLEATYTEWAPWQIVRSDTKRRACLNCLSHPLSLMPYDYVAPKDVKLSPRSTKGAYDDVASIEDRRWIPERF